MFRLAPAAAVLITLVGCASPRDLASLRPLTDEEFWRLSSHLSEPPGTFDLSDNLVSNEWQFAKLAARLTPRGGVYVGVGPEQNFSYMARLEPVAAFIVDIRPENRHLHLMYKAIFELAADRADFVARLFSRSRPLGVTAASSVSELFAALDGTRSSPDVHEETRRLIRARLVDHHRFPLTDDDLRSIDETLSAFFTDGPSIRYDRSRPPHPTRPSYRVLMNATDAQGEPQSFLASEEAFAYVKALQTRNLVVPVVGDFAGPRTIRAVAAHARERGLKVTAFYASNVEVHLTRDQQRAFCGSLGTLPHDEDSWFIESHEMRRLAAKLTACANIPPSLRWP